MGDNIITTVEGCARCGGKHADLDFKPFSQNSIKDSDGADWTHWALCPATGEPLILQVVQTDQIVYIEPPGPETKN
jgi:hypothetical protein